MMDLREGHHHPKPGGELPISIEGFYYNQDRFATDVVTVCEDFLSGFDGYSPILAGQYGANAFDVLRGDNHSVGINDVDVAYVRILERLLYRLLGDE